MAKPHVGLALAVVVAFCGSADAFVVGAPGGSGRVAAGRTRPTISSVSAVVQGRLAVVAGALGRRLVRSLLATRCAHDAVANLSDTLVLVCDVLDGQSSRAWRWGIMCATTTQR